MPLSLVKKAAARCGLAFVTLVLAPLAGLVFGLLLAVAFLFGKGGTESGSATRGREEYLFTGVSWVVLSFLFAPRGYLVSREGIVIRRAVGSFTIPAVEVESVELVGRVRPEIRLSGYLRDILCA